MSPGQMRDDSAVKPMPRVGDRRSGYTANPRRTVYAFSAGGVVLRGQRAAREILLVGREHWHRSGRLWTLPKGTPRPDESPQQTALREVCEETGVEVAITGYAGVIAYSFIAQDVRYRKRVAYYTMIAIGGDTSLHDHEYDYASWFAVQRALQVMRHPNEIAIVGQVIGAHELAMPKDIQC